MAFNGSSFLLLVLVAVFGDSALNKPAPFLGGEKSHFSGHRFGYVPEYEDPSKEDWIGIIQSTMQGETYQNYVQAKNYTFRINETGCFENTKGDKGTWNLTSHMFLHMDEDQSHRRTITIESIAFNKFHIARGTFAITTYRYLDKQGPFGMAEVYEQVLFLISENNTFELVGTLEGISTGLISKPANGTVDFSTGSSTRRNITNEYSLITTSVKANITLGNDRNEVFGITEEESMPLGKAEGHGTMAQMLTWGRSPEPASMKANMTGYFDNGISGSYHLETHYSAVNMETGVAFDTVSVCNGEFENLEPHAGVLYSHEFGLLELISRNVF